MRRQIHTDNRQRRVEMHFPWPEVRICSRNENKPTSQPKSKKTEPGPKHKQPLTTCDQWGRELLESPHRNMKKPARSITSVQSKNKHTGSGKSKSRSGRECSYTLNQRISYLPRYRSRLEVGLIRIISRAAGPPGGRAVKSRRDARIDNGCSHRAIEAPIALL